MNVTPIRRVPLTAAQVAKNRYDEARAIKDAWEHRLRKACAEHADAVRHGGDTAATQRNINAVNIDLADATGELQVALNAWMSTTTPERRTA